MTHYFLNHRLMPQGARPYPSQIPHSQVGRTAAKIFQAHLA
jgi:hypothetical protein